MKRYELKRCVTFEEAQEMGAKGWMLVAVIPETDFNYLSFFFQREVEDGTATEAQHD